MYINLMQKMNLIQITFSDCLFNAETYCLHIYISLIYGTSLLLDVLTNLMNHLLTLPLDSSLMFFYD